MSSIYNKLAEIFRKYRKNIFPVLEPELESGKERGHTHAHTHTYSYIHVFILNTHKSYILSA